MKSQARGQTPLAELARVQRQLGLMDAKLRVAWWALLGSIDDLGDDYEATLTYAGRLALGDPGTAE